jgi:hypothetical protein
VRFALETDKTPKQCIKALQDRIGKSETKSRPNLTGSTDKDSGRFTLELETKVIGPFKRRTRLRGVATRTSGTTTLRGFVPNGMARNQLLLVGFFVLALAIFMFVRGQLIYAIMIVLAGAAMAIPLIGDNENYDELLYELEKATKAKPAKD